MTDLIQSQLKVIAVMVYCGLTAGLIIDVFRLFISRFFKNKKIFTVITKIFCCMAIAFFIGDFSFFLPERKADSHKRHSLCGRPLVVEKILL